MVFQLITKHLNPSDITQQTHCGRISRELRISIATLLSKSRPDPIVLPQKVDSAVDFDAAKEVGMEVMDALIVVVVHREAF